MIRRFYIIVILIGLIIPSLLHADPQIDKEIEKEWFLRDKDPESIKKIREKGLDEGMGNIEDFSEALVIEGYRSVKRDPVKAMMLFQSAKELSPDYPSAYYATGKVYWKQSVLNIFKTLDEFLSGYKATLKNFWWLFFTVGNLSLALIISFLTSFLLFSLLIVIRYLPLLNHDIKEWLPRISHLVVKSIPVAFILLFFFLNPGFLYLYLFLLILLWPYFSNKEKGMGLLSLICIAILPLIMPLLLSFVSAQSSPGLKAIVEINKGSIDERGLIELEERIKKNPDNIEATFSLALAKKRRGNFNEALTFYDNLLNEKSISDRVYNNIGNIHAAKKNFVEAFSSYNSALEKNPGLVSSHYNLSQVYREALRFDEGEKEYQEARRINPELLKVYSSLKGLSFNRLVVDEGLTNIEIWKNALRRSKENDKLAESVWLQFMKWVPSHQAPYLLISICIVMFAYIFLVRRRTSVYSCIKCGNVVCRKCQTVGHEQDMCEQCYKILIQMEGSSQSRIEKILALRKYQDRKKGLLKIIAFFPGIGHLYEGRSIKGLIFIFSIIFLLSWWFLWDYLKTPFKIYPSITGPARLSFILISLAVYALLFINGRRLSR